MTPLPKRRHSSRRQGKREATNLKTFLMSPIKCPKCSSARLSHHACPKCGFYK